MAGCLGPAFRESELTLAPSLFTKDPEANFRFFDLPYDVRERVYQFALTHVNAANPGQTHRKPTIDPSEHGFHDKKFDAPLRFANFSYLHSSLFVNKQFSEEIQQVFYECNKFIRAERDVAPPYGGGCKKDKSFDIEVTAVGPAAAAFKNWTLAFWVNQEERPPWHDELDGNIGDEDLLNGIKDKGPGSSSASDAGSAALSYGNSSADRMSDIHDLSEPPPVANQEPRQPEYILLHADTLNDFLKLWTYNDMSTNTSGSGSGVTMSLRLQIPPILASRPGSLQSIPTARQRQLILPFGACKLYPLLFCHSSIDPSVRAELNKKAATPYDPPQTCLLKAAKLHLEGKDLLFKDPAEPQRALQTFVKAFGAMHVTIDGRYRKIWAYAWFDQTFEDGPFEGSYGNEARIARRISLVADVIEAYRVWASQLTREIQVRNAGQLPALSDPRLKERNELLGDAVFWGMRTIHLLRQAFIGAMHGSGPFWWEDVQPRINHQNPTSTPLPPVSPQPPTPPPSEWILSQARTNAMNNLTTIDRLSDHEIGLLPREEAHPQFSQSPALGEIYKRTALALKDLQRREWRRLARVARVYRPGDGEVVGALREDAEGEVGRWVERGLGNMHGQRGVVIDAEGFEAWVLSR